ncbi:MAG: hypothetical protein R2865_06735 [Deinococcales bacterium]
MLRRDEKNRYLLSSLKAGAKRITSAQQPYKGCWIKSMRRIHSLSEAEIRKMFAELLRISLEFVVKAR